VCVYTHKREEEEEVIYLANAFSLKMVGKERTVIDIFPSSLEEVREIVSQFPFESIIGHEGTAQVMSSLLGVEVKVNRVTFTMKDGDTLIVGLPSGGRLPEGKVLSREELESIQLDWFIVQRKEEV